MLQLLILWDENDYYRRFNIPFVVSILFKTLQVLTALVSHSVLVCMCVYIYIYIMRSWVLRNIIKFVGNESRKNIHCALYWDVYIIYNVLILYLINCVTTKNELIDMFVSLGSEVINGSVLS
jgi:hypothetical protein